LLVVEAVLLDLETLAAVVEVLAVIVLLLLEKVLGVGHPQKTK